MSDDVLLHRIEELEADNARLRRTLAHRGVGATLRHQLRNTLAMVRDVVRSSAETGHEAADYAAHLEGRLDALFRVQTRLASGVADGVGLRDLVADEFLACATGEGERLSIEGDEVVLGAPSAALVALAVHELATNAVKFGALAAPKGRVAVRWATAIRHGGRPWLTLDWVEAGVPAPSEPMRRGFGTEVVERALRYQLGGEGQITFAPDGLRCRMLLPLAPDPADAPRPG